MADQHRIQIPLPNRVAFRMKGLIAELLVEEGVRFGDSKSKLFRDVTTTLCGSLAGCLGRLVVECAPKGDLEEALDAVCSMLRRAAAGDDQDAEDSAP